MSGYFEEAMKFVGGELKSFQCNALIKLDCKIIYRIILAKSNCNNQQKALMIQFTQILKKQKSLVDMRKAALAMLLLFATPTVPTNEDISNNTFNLYQQTVSCERWILALVEEYQNTVEEMSSDADKHDVIMNEDFREKSSINHNVIKTLTCRKSGFPDVGYGITNKKSVIELFTKIEVPINKNFHCTEIQSYDEEIARFMTQFIFPLSVCFGDVLSANRSPTMEPVKVICTTFSVAKPNFNT